MAVRMPDALKTERDEIDENEWKEIQKVINEALENIANFDLIRNPPETSMSKITFLPFAQIRSTSLFKVP
jgi:hypothetical protein